MIRNKSALLLIFIAVAMIFSPITAYAYDPVVSLMMPYQAKVTTGLHGGTETAYDFANNGSQIIFRTSATSSFQVRGVVDNINIVPAYDRNGNFSHNEKFIYLQVQVAYPGTQSWVNMARILYGHVDNNSTLKKGDLIFPGTVIGKNSTAHQGTGPWYRSNGRLLTTGPHLHFERMLTNAGWTPTVMSLGEGTTYPISTTVYRFEWQSSVFPTAYEE